MTKQRIKSAGDKVAKAAKHAGKKIGEAAVVVGDLNDDGKVDHEDARIAAAKAKVLAAKAADGAGTLMKKAGKHDMVKDAAAGAGIGALAAMPLPVIGPAVGAAVGAIAGVVKHMRSQSKSTPEGNPSPGSSLSPRSRRSVPGRGQRLPPPIPPRHAPEHGASRVPIRSSKLDV